MGAAKILKDLYKGKKAYPPNAVSFGALYPAVALAGALAAGGRPPADWLPPQVWTRLLVEVGERLRPSLIYSPINFGFSPTDGADSTILGYALYNAVYRGGAFPIVGLRASQRAIEDAVRWVADVLAQAVKDGIIVLEVKG